MHCSTEEETKHLILLVLSKAAPIGAALYIRKNFTKSFRSSNSDTTLRHLEDIITMKSRKLPILKVTGDLTKDEANTIAETTILSLYGEEVKNEYTYEDTVYTDTELTVQYTVVYR